jgi:ABC-type glutathione transport system ATPase component
MSTTALGEESAALPPRDPAVLRSRPGDRELLAGPLLGSDESHHDTSAIVSLEAVHKTYLLGVEGVPALRGVSLSVRSGEFLMIIGSSGGGKSSLLNVIVRGALANNGLLYLFF